MLALTTLGGGCTRNPATGKLVFNTMNEREEVAFGEDISEELENAVAEYRHEELNAYVSEIGHKMAAVS
jgi:predicted Zn-dependent protease